MRFTTSIGAMDKSLQTAARHLMKVDPTLAILITKFGDYPVKPHSRYYQELVESIISQQLSIKAAATITKRFVDLFGGQFPSPAQILARDHDSLRSAGLSNAKANYVRDLAGHIASGELQIEKLPQLSNEEVIKELVAVKGIGEWTAHMFLIFSLGRLDVLPTGDLGLRSGIKRIYGLADMPSPTEVTKLAADKKWQPYESVATWYIWQGMGEK